VRHRLVLNGAARGGGEWRTRRHGALAAIQILRRAGIATGPDWISFGEALPQDDMFGDDLAGYLLGWDGDHIGALFIGQKRAQMIALPEATIAGPPLQNRPTIGWIDRRSLDEAQVALNERLERLQRLI